MDKAQKSLLDTYFRKRKLADETSDYHKFMFYELEYLVSRDMYDASKIKPQLAVYMLLHHPELINKFDISKFNDELLFELLDSDKLADTALKYLPIEYIQKLTTSKFTVLLWNNPHLIDRFVKIMPEKFDSTVINMLIGTYPELENYFDKIFNNG